ncbi:MAG: hypothetical protein HOP19_21200 [Acidobacteria bacterium]|nr:hypothetical protein [Acidobacteriota bacterium]
MSCTEEINEKEITAMSRVLNAYLKATQEFNLDDREGKEKLLRESHQRHVQEFMQEASKITGFFGKCPDGFKECRGFCIPDGEDCLGE